MDCMGTKYLPLDEAAKLFSKVVALFCDITNDEQAFPLLHVLAKPFVAPIVCVMVTHCCFNLKFLNDMILDTMLVLHILVIFIFSLERFVHQIFCLIFNHDISFLMVESSMLI